MWRVTKGKQRSLMTLDGITDYLKVKHASDHPSHLVCDDMKLLARFYGSLLTRSKATFSTLSTRDSLRQLVDKFNEYLTKHAPTPLP